MSEIAKTQRTEIKSV